MKISINLLPQKPMKNYALILTLGLSVITLMVFLIVGMIYYQSLQREYASLESRISTTIQLQEMVAENENNAPDIPQLNRYVERLEREQISSIYVLDQFISQLPPKVSFVNYDYTDTGLVTINANFEAKREISSYLHHLNSLPFIMEAMIESVRTETDTDTNDEGEQIRSNEIYAASFSITMDMEQVKRLQQEMEVTHADGEEESG